MEVLGSAAALIQLAGVGLAVAQALYRIRDEGASNQEQVMELAFYVETTSHILEEVGRVLQEEGKARKPLINGTALITTRNVVAKCKGIFETLGGMAESAQKSSIGLLMFPLKSSRIAVLQTRLDRSKIDLQLLMNIILLARLKHNDRVNTNEDEKQLAIVGELIQERDNIYERNCIAEQGAGQVDTDHSSSTSIPQKVLMKQSSGVAQPLDAIAGTERCSKDVSVASVPSVDGNICGEDYRNRKSLDQKQIRKKESDISYWIALYLVCCPCISMTRKSSRARHKLETPEPPINGINPTSPIVPRGSTSSPISPRPSHRLHMLRELGAEMMPAEIQDPKIDRRSEIILAPPVGPKVEEYPGEITSSFPKSFSFENSPIPVEGGVLPAREAHKAEIDRLLHEWTLLYDGTCEGQAKTQGIGKQ